MGQAKREFEKERQSTQGTESKYAGGMIRSRFRYLGPDGKYRVTTKIFNNEQHRDRYYASMHTWGCEFDEEAWTEDMKGNRL